MTHDDLRILDKHLFPALQEGLIQMAIPNKTRSRNQRCRHTPTGLEFLRQTEETP